MRARPILVLLLAATPALSQQPVSDLFEEAIEVRVVNVEVVVTDSKGNRVSDLPAASFSLEVDGQQVPISFFSEIADGVASTSVSPAAEPIGTPPGTRPGAELSTNFLIFIDDALTVQSDRDRVLEELAQQVLASGFDDRVSMVAYDGSSLETLTHWTRDREEFSAAIARAMARPAFGARTLGDLRAMDEWARDKNYLEERQQILIDQAGNPGGANPGGDGGGGDSGAPNVAQDVAYDREPADAVLTGFLSGPDLATAKRLSDAVQGGVSASVHALRTSAAPAGRKVMILLLGNWPLSPASYVANRFGDSMRDVAAGELDMKYAASRNLFAPLTETANLLGFSLYPVDVAGEDQQRSFDATDRPNEFEFANPTSGAGGSNFDRELNVHAALDHLAEQTGGLALINSARDHAYRRAVADTRSFYWLGFTPQRAGDNARHALNVSVRNRPELTVRARSSFVDRSLETENDMTIESALLFEQVVPRRAESPPNGLAVTYGESQKAGARKVRVPVEVGIPMDAVTLLEQQGRFVNSLEIRFLLMDESGNRSEVAFDRIPINGSQAPAAGQRLWYETQLTMRRRGHRVVVTVFDPLAGTTLTHSVDLEQ